MTAQPVICPVCGAEMRPYMGGKDWLICSRVGCSFIRRIKRPSIIGNDFWVGVIAGLCLCVALGLAAARVCEMVGGG